MAKRMSENALQNRRQMENNRIVITKQRSMIAEKNREIGRLQEQEAYLQNQREQALQNQREQQALRDKSLSWNYRGLNLARSR
jgi:hypothetical protein